MCARGLGSRAPPKVTAVIPKRARMPNEDGPGARSAALTFQESSWRALGDQPWQQPLLRPRAPSGDERRRYSRVSSNIAVTHLQNQNSPFAGSNDELERPRRGKESALCAQNTNGAHSASHKLSRPLQAIVRRTVIDAASAPREPSRAPRRQRPAQRWELRVRPHHPALMSLTHLGSRKEQRSSVEPQATIVGVRLRTDRPRPLRSITNETDAARPRRPPERARQRTAAQRQACAQWVRTTRWGARVGS